MGLKIFEGEQVRADSNVLIDRIDLSSLISKDDHAALLDAENPAKFRVTIETDARCREEVTVELTCTGKRVKWRRPWRNSAYRWERLLAQERTFQENDVAEEERIAQRCALDSNIAALHEFEPPEYKTRRMEELIQSCEGNVSLSAESVSRLSCEEFAHKRFSRSAVVNKRALKTLFNELKILKRLRHRHCVELVRRRPPGPDKI